MENGKITNYFLISNWKKLILTPFILWSSRSRSSLPFPIAWSQSPPQSSLHSCSLLTDTSACLKKLETGASSPAKNQTTLSLMTMILLPGHRLQPREQSLAWEVVSKCRLFTRPSAIPCVEHQIHHFKSN